MASTRSGPFEWGSMHHFRKTWQVYESHRRADNTKQDCTLCVERNLDTVIHMGDTMYVVKNRVQYDMFEGRRVEDHLLVMPKTHKESTAEFTSDEGKELLAIIAEYEAKGYGFYGRGVGSPTRSVKHQHTHLIKLIPKRPKFVVVVNKPYFVLSK